MANVSDIEGAVVIGTLGGKVAPRVSTYVALSGESNNIGVGDIVKVAGNTDTLGQYLAVTLMSNGATDVPLGMVVGVDPIKGVTVGSENLNRVYRPASTQYYLRVCDDPNVLFWMQDDGASGSTVTAAQLGYNASVNITSTCNTTTGFSQFQIKASTVATTNTFPIKMHGLLNRADNALGQYQKILCSFNTHYHVTGTGTTAA